MALSESRKKEIIEPQDNLCEHHQFIEKFKNFDFEKARRNDILIDDIKSMLRVYSDNDIIRKIKDNLEISKDLKLKNELFAKLNNLYLDLMGQERRTVDISELWRWIKHIIKQISLQNDKTKQIDEEELRECLLYKEYCERLIREYDLNNFEELEMFINRLLEKNKKNQKRVEKIKKLLLTG